MKKFLKLRTAIMAKDVKQEDLAALIGISSSTFSKKMNGLSAWTFWEGYELCRALNIPDQQLSEYFPRDLAVPYDGVATKLEKRNGGKTK